jgi:hypothetical protein
MLDTSESARSTVVVRAKPIVLEAFNPGGQFAQGYRHEDIAHLVGRVKLTFDKNQAGLLFV